MRARLNKIALVCIVVIYAFMCGAVIYFVGR
jgi:hypothetical protein